MAHWDPDSAPFIVGDTVYDAFSLGRQLYKSLYEHYHPGDMPGSIDEDYDLEDRPRVLGRAERVKESLIEFYLLQKEARELKLWSMDEGSRATLDELMLQGGSYIGFIRTLISAFDKFCIEDEEDPTEAFFMAGFIGARDPAQAAAMENLADMLEDWAREYKRLESRLGGSEDRQ